MRPWHALLAPLPAEATVSRKPVTPPELANDPSAAAIAGWEQLTVELSAGPHGLRHLLVVLDATGQPISASDHVLLIREVSKELHEYVHDSLGGRLEPNGTFNGTRWHMVRVLAPDEEPGEAEPPGEAQSAKPTADDVLLIKALVAEILRRADSRQE